MHYSKALWGEDSYIFRPERWEHGAPHRLLDLNLWTVITFFSCRLFSDSAMAPKQCCRRCEWLQFVLIWHNVAVILTMWHAFIYFLRHTIICRARSVITCQHFEVCIHSICSGSPCLHGARIYGGGAESDHGALFLTLEVVVNIYSF